MAPLEGRAGEGGVGGEQGCIGTADNHMMMGGAPLDPLDPDFVVGKKCNLRKKCNLKGKIDLGHFGCVVLRVSVF